MTRLVRSPLDGAAAYDDPTRLGLRLRPVHFVVAVLFGAISSSTLHGSMLHAGEAPTEVPAAIVVRNLPRNVFAESQVVVRIDFPDAPRETTRVVWSLESLEGRALMRNEVGRQPGTKSATITCRFPPLEDGVVLPLRFHVAVDQTTNVVEQKLWVFSRSAWTGHRAALERAKITLFDPAKTTGEHLTAAEIPFEETANAAALGDLRESLILVGEGVDFREHPGLASMLWRAAAAGNRVVCLSPTEGSLAFGEEPTDVAPSSFALRRRDVLTDFDPRLDVELWSGADALPTRYLAPRSDANVPSLEITDDAAAWPWTEVRFAPGSGRLIVCGFGLFNGWETSPTPRYLLVHLLTLGSPSRSVSNTPER